MDYKNKYIFSHVQKLLRFFWFSLFLFVKFVSFHKLLLLFPSVVHFLFLFVSAVLLFSGASQGWHVLQLIFVLGAAHGGAWAGCSRLLATSGRTHQTCFAVFRCVSRLPFRFPVFRWFPLFFVVLRCAVPGRAARGFWRRLVGRFRRFSLGFVVCRRVSLLFVMFRCVSVFSFDFRCVSTLVAAFCCLWLFLVFVCCAFVTR